MCYDFIVADVNEFFAILICIIYFLARGKECNINTDCIGIQDTSCVKDYDTKLRCLCGDYRAPVNGYCSTKDKGK